MQQNEECINFFKNRLTNIYNENDITIKEIIKNAKNSIKYTIKANKDIYLQLENMKDDNNVSISNSFKYKHYNRIKKIEEDLTIWVIINKTMSSEIKNPNIMQFFGDATYRCVPPTFRRYRLYIISGLNLNLLNTKILAYILLPNETEITYEAMFEILKKNYGFNPYIFTSDFNKASNKAIKKVFPKVYVIKCFFHFVQALWKNFKKYKLADRDNIKETKELAFNLKKLAFTDPENISKIYKKILKKYKDKKYDEFFKYFNRTWKPNCKFKNIKYYPDWNYYHIISSIEFDIKHLYLTNNIAEHINKSLNSNLKSKYPTFENWRAALLKVEDSVNNIPNVISRYDYTTKILLYYIKMEKETKNSIDILPLNDIYRLNSLIFPETNLSNLFTVSKYFNIDICEDDINEIMELNDDINSISSEESDNEYENIENKENLDIESIDNLNLFQRINEKKDFSFNIEKYVNSLDFNMCKTEQEKEINEYLVKNNIKLEEEKNFDKKNKNKKNKNS